MKWSFFYFVLTFLLITSCQKSKCNSTEEWIPTVTYAVNEIVWYNDTCWVAINQGRGIEPGPWLQNENDVWMPCLDNR